MEEGTSPLRVNTAIRYRDQSDIDAIKEAFGEAIREMALVTITYPSDLKNFLSNLTMSSCFITVEAAEIVKEMQKKSRCTPYEDLPRKARNTVGKSATSLSRSNREVGLL